MINLFSLNDKLFVWKILGFHQCFLKAFRRRNKKGIKRGNGFFRVKCGTLKRYPFTFSSCKKWEYVCALKENARQTPLCSQIAIKRQRSIWWLLHQQTGAPFLVLLAQSLGHALEHVLLVAHCPASTNLHRWLGDWAAMCGVGCTQQYIVYL